jgi:hypothetical protein
MKQELQKLQQESKMGQKGKDLTAKDLEATKKKLQDVEAKLKLAMSDKQAALQVCAFSLCRLTRAACVPEPVLMLAAGQGLPVQHAPGNAMAGFVLRMICGLCCCCCCCSQDKSNLERQLKQLNSKSTLLEKNLEKKDAQVTSCWPAIHQTGVDG